MGPGVCGDTSQNGNWSSFRNGTFNGKRNVITPESFRSMPRSGKMTFDYCSTARPVINEEMIVLSDYRCIRIMTNLFLLPVSEFKKATKVIKVDLILFVYIPN